MLFFNGKFIGPDQAKIAITDRGFLLSDGVFETMKSYRGIVFCIEKHWDRLQTAATYLDIQIPMSFSEFEKIVCELLKINNLMDLEASLRLTITRGEGPRGLLPPNDVRPTVMLTAVPLTAHATHPVRLAITSIRRNEFTRLSNIKSLNYLDNILARTEAVKKGADDGIILNTVGNLACASAANIFLVNEQGTVITPRIEDGVLPGITRAVVIEICHSNAIHIEERSIAATELTHAKEIFITNSIVEIQPVIMVNDQLIVDGEIGSTTKKIQDAYQAEISECVKQGEERTKLSSMSI